MARFMRILTCVLLLGVLLASPTLASHGGHSNSSEKSVHVNGYYRKDGTYVQPYDRRPPGTAEQEPGSVSRPSQRDVIHARLHAQHEDSWRYGSGSKATPPADFYGVRRDADGKIHRNEAAKHAFMRLHPCPSTGLTTGPCPGYVVDHVVALKRGGADDPSNMQWQTVDAAKAKDRIE